MLYKLYQFTDDGPDDTDDPSFIGPVPTFDVRRIQAENIPRSGRLVDLMADLNAADAFIVWAAEVLGAHEQKTAQQAQLDDFGIDLDALEEARCNTVRVLASQVIGEGKGKGYNAHIRSEVGESIATFLTGGMTLRQMASYMDLPLGDVVMLAIGPRAKARAKAIADLEETIVDGGLERHTTRELLLMHGLTGAFHLLIHLCELHGVDARDAAKVRRELAA